MFRARVLAQGRSSGGRAADLAKRQRQGFTEIEGWTGHLCGRRPLVDDSAFNLPVFDRNETALKPIDSNVPGDAVEPNRFGRAPCIVHQGQACQSK